MSLDTHTTKPIHPIFQRILDGKESTDRLIQGDSIHDDSPFYPTHLTYPAKGG